jgi:predicted DNA-binding transcriptional regulator YafY
MPMVVHQMTIEEIVKSSFSMNPGMLLYLLARIYFAVKEKRVIELAYRSNSSSTEKPYRLHPYGWVYREQSIYLVTYNEQRTKIELFRITRISGLVVLDSRFNEVPPDMQTIFKNSGGVYVSSDLHKVTLQAALDDRNLVMENFGHLYADISEAGAFISCSFIISDLYWLCQRLLPLEGRIKITGSAETVLKVKLLMKQAVKNMF